MYPVNHTFHPFLQMFENSIKKQVKNENQKDLVDLIIFKIKSELFKAQSKEMNFLLPVLESENILKLYMIPSINEIDFGSVRVELKAKEPAMKEIEMISVIYGYCQNGDICYDANLSQVLCSLHTSYEQKIKLLIGTEDFGTEN